MTEKDKISYKINEIVDRIQANAPILMDYILHKRNEYTPENHDSMKITLYEFTVDYSKDYSIPLLLTITWFPHPNVKRDYRKKRGVPHTCYDFENKEIHVFINIIDDWFNFDGTIHDVQNALGYGWVEYKEEELLNHTFKEVYGGFKDKILEDKRKLQWTTDYIPLFTRYYEPLTDKHIRLY